MRGFNRRGKRQSPSSAAPLSPGTASATAPSSALKTILIIVGHVLIGVVGIATLTFIGIRVARHTRVSQQGDHVKVDTPFGSVETSKDPEQAAKDLGIDVYPGAEVQKNGASSATFGNSPHRQCSV